MTLNHPFNHLFRPLYVRSSPQRMWGGGFVGSFDLFSIFLSVGHNVVPTPPPRNVCHALEFVLKMRGGGCKYAPSLLLQATPPLVTPYRHTLYLCGELTPLSPTLDNPTLCPPLPSAKAYVKLLLP